MKKKLLIPILALAVCFAAVCGWSLSRERAANPRQPVVTHVDTDLQFSELCTKNETILADNDGRYRDYVELYNAGEDFDLTGCCLTDGKVQSAPLEGVLRSGEYRLFFLGTDLTGFGLGAYGGDCIQLLSPAGQVLAQTTTTALQDDQVMLAEKNSYRVSTEASPGFPNDEAGLAAFRTGSLNTEPKLVVSEVLVENASVLPNPQGIYCDVIELYNCSAETLQLSDYFLSDRPQERFRFRLPQQELAPGQYVLVWCDSENLVDDHGAIHTNFGLRFGDTLCVTDKNGAYTTLPITFVGEDRVTALTEDGSYEAAAPSLGYANNENGQEEFRLSRMDHDPALTVTEILLSSAGVPHEGRFCDVVEICNRSDSTVSTEGWYLSDGGDPLGYALPKQELAPQQRLLIVCDRSTTGFGLSREDTLRLRTPEGLWASVVSCGGVEQGRSIVCMGAGEETVCTTAPVSLGFVEDENGRQQYLQAVRPAGLQISELMSANNTYLQGAYGTTCDWIELYNAGSEPVDLSDYALSDNANEPARYPLPAMTLEPGAYGVIFLSESSENLLRGYEVLPMNLSSQGETLYLSKGGSITDYVFLPALAGNTAYGRAADSSGFSLLADPTPGKVNSAAAQISRSVTVDTPQGVYPAGDLTVTLSAPGQIYYTTDCTVPNRNDILYTGPITLSKTTVLRVVVCEEGKEPSAVTDLTYLIGEDDSLPAISVVTTPANLFDPYTGIYAEGYFAAPESPHIGANYWMDWEKPATISLFENDGSGFSEPCGLKIFGGFSRALYMKSFSCYFRSRYGTSTLNYPLFGESGLDSYECFILRSSGQDLLGARMRDVLATSLMAEHTNMPVQKYRPVVVYLNGQFWGVYYIREKINENYVAGNFNTTPDDVDLTVADGYSSANYRALMQYVYSHNLSNQEYYDYVCSQIDVDNYIDYIIGEIWIGNGDNGNIKFFRTSQMKWTWIMYDTDWGFTSAGYDTVADHLNPYGTGSDNAFETSLILGLLKNPEFKDKFLRRFAWQMQNVWNEENVLKRVDELENLLAHDLKKDYARWNRSYDRWLEDVEEVRQFTAVRHKNIVVYLRNYFGLSESQMRDYGFPV